jgi:hypothetical protein
MTLLPVNRDAVQQTRTLGPPSTSSILRICGTRTWTAGRTQQPERPLLLFYGAKIRLEVHQLSNRHRLAEIAHW